MPTKFYPLSYEPRINILDPTIRAIEWEQRKLRKSDLGPLVDYFERWRAEWAHDRMMFPPPTQPVASDVKTTGPARNHLVSYDGATGYIIRVDKDSVWVQFPGDRIEALDREWFRDNYNSPRGRHTWFIHNTEDKDGHKIWEDYIRTLKHNGG